MNKPQNSYESLKSDVKETGYSLFIVGGLIILGLIILSAIMGIASSNLDTGLKTIIICCLSIIMGLLIFNGKFRMWVLGGWLILLVSIPLLLVLYIIISLIYNSLTGKYLINPY